MLFYLYTQHVLDCARFLAHACTASYHNSSTEPGIFRYPRLYSLLCMHVHTKGILSIRQATALRYVFVSQFCSDLVLKQVVASVFFSFVLTLNFFCLIFLLCLFFLGNNFWYWIFFSLKSCGLFFQIWREINVRPTHPPHSHLPPNHTLPPLTCTLPPVTQDLYPYMGWITPFIHIFIVSPHIPLRDLCAPA